MNAKKLRLYNCHDLRSGDRFIFGKMSLNNAQEDIVDIGQERSYACSRYSNVNGKVYYLKAGYFKFKNIAAEVIVGIGDKTSYKKKHYL
jgi:hypothetical protein